MSDVVEKKLTDIKYSNVLRFMTYASLGSSVPSFFFTLFMPNVQLP